MVLPARRRCKPSLTPSPWPRRNQSPPEHNHQADPIHLRTPSVRSSSNYYTSTLQRWTFHFTPTSASWLNAIEGFFAILAKRRVKRGVFRSVADLQAAINRFLDHHNAHSKPFQLVADPDKFIAAVRRGHQVVGRPPPLPQIRTCSFVG